MHTLQLLHSQLEFTQLMIDALPRNRWPRFEDMTNNTPKDLPTNNPQDDPTTDQDTHIKDTHDDLTTNCNSKDFLETTKRITVTTKGAPNNVHGNSNLDAWIPFILQRQRTNDDRTIGIHDHLLTPGTRINNIAPSIANDWRNTSTHLRIHYPRQSTLIHRKAWLGIYTTPMHR